MAAADRNLLFGLLALQNGLIDQVQLVAAFQAWTRDKQRDLAEHLLARGDLDDEQRGTIEAMVALHIKKHGSTQESLAAIPAGRSTRESLARLGDPQIDASLARFSSGTTHCDDDADRTASYAVGSATSDGQRFRILRPHAQGGLGAIFVALDSELHREVALKQILESHADDPESRRRFLLEAEVTGGLEHPGIVPVYGLGTYADGRPFYAMRFVKGDSLKEAIAAFYADETLKRHSGRRSLELRKLLRRFLDVCNAIEFAHSRGVLHRDLKPSNVVLGKHGETLVVDWGLAKALGRVESASGSEERPLVPSPFSGSAETLPGSALGTPAYMSPEQATGELDRLGPQSDVYSLGATLYCLLTGRPPFAGEVGDVLRGVQKGEFLRPRALDSTIAPALEAICLKAMAHRPEGRYSSARALAEDLERWMADEPVPVFREPATARLARWARRHRPIVAGAAALLLTAVAALSAGIVLVGREQRRTERQRLVAEEHRSRADLNADEANQRAEALRRRDAISRVNLAYREYLDDNVALADELLDGCPEDLRAWEWAYARRLGHAELRSWTASSQQGRDVWCVAFAPDGARIAAGTGPWFGVGDGTTGELVIREIRSGREAFALRPLKGAVQAVAYSPDGRTLAAAHGFSGPDEGAVVFLLDAADGREIWRSAERGKQVLSLAFAPDGRTLAAGCGGFNEYEKSGYVRIRDAKTGGELGPRIPGGPGGVTAVALAPDGRTLAMASRDVVDLCDLADARRPIVRRLSDQVNFVYTVAFSPDGRRLATGGYDRTVRIWDRETGRRLDAVASHRGFVRGLAFSPDGRQLVSGSEDKSVRRWDLDDGEMLTFHGHTGFVHCVAFSPDGALAASGSLDGTVKLWPAAAPDSQVTFRNGAGWVGALTFAPDGRRVASAHNGEVRIWDPRTGEELRRIIARHGMLGNIVLALSPDGATLAASGPDGDVILWETARWTRRGVLAGAPDAIDAAFAPDGRILATAGGDGTLRLWDVAGCRMIRAFPGHEPGDNAMAFSPDGRHIAMAGEDQVVRVWDAATGGLLASLTGHTTGVRDVAFSPDGRSLASVGGAYHGPMMAEVKIWDWADGRESASFHGHTGLVTGVAYLPDGRRLVTTSDDRTVKLWDLKTGEAVLTLRGHTSGVASLAVSRDGRQIASGSIDNSARIWSIEAPEGEAAFELALRRAAVERVQSLFARHLLQEDVLAELRADTSLGPRLRAAALEVAERRAVSASRLYEAAWLTIARPGGKADDNRLAVRQVEAACRTAAEDPSRLVEYRRALALALYRVDRPAEALAILREQAEERPGQPTTTLDLAVTAMASRRLGRDAEARLAMEKLRAIVKSDTMSNNHDAVGFLEEAEELSKKNRPEQ